MVHTKPMLGSELALEEGRKWDLVRFMAATDHLQDLFGGSLALTFPTVTLQAVPSIAAAGRRASAASAADTRSVNHRTPSCLPGLPRST